MIYLGIKGYSRDIFRADSAPRSSDYPQFSYVVGTFRSLAGAEFMRDHGANNPHCVCVADAERLARKLRERGEL